MGPLALLLVIVGSFAVGIGCQFAGHARERYEWEIGTVAALYGALLGNGVLGARWGTALAVDGLYVIPAALGAVVFAALLVGVFRAFGSPISSTRQLHVDQAATFTRSVRLGYTPTLFERPILDDMRRRFGVTASVMRAEVSGADGWIEADLTGVADAIEEAVASAQRQGIPVEPRPVERPSMPRAA
jgi:hypothetical protein